MVRALFILPAVMTLLVIAFGHLRNFARQTPAPPPRIGRQLMWILCMALAMAATVAPMRQLRDAGYAFLEALVLPSPGYFMVLAFAPLIWQKHPQFRVRAALTFVATLLLTASLAWSNDKAEMLRFSGMTGVLIISYWTILVAINAAAALWKGKN